MGPTGGRGAGAAIVEGRPISVVLADDHPLFLTAMSRALAATERLALVAQASDGRDALRTIMELRPDVAIIDLDLPSLPGLELIETLQRERTPTRAIVLSAFLDSARVHRAVAAGARAYLVKSTSADTVLETIERVHAGDTVLPPEAQSALAEHIRGQGTDRQVLSARERQVLTLAADGLPMTDIAARLSATVPAIRGELHGIYDKLEVSDRASAVAAAIRHQLL